MAVTTPLEGSRTRAEHTHREAWIDNLRVAVIVGVIGAHVSLIYALDVGWYYEERTASEAAEAALAAVFSPGLLFGMGLLFFVAGLFTPPAFERKGARRFVSDRVWRLGVPAVAYVFVVNPAMNVIGDRAMGEHEGLAEYFRRTYWDDAELGIAWFIAALLVFSLAYAGWRSRHSAGDADVAALRHRDLVVAATFIAVASFVVRLLWPFLGTDRLWGLNVWEYPQMITLFFLGAMAQERHWITEGLPPALRRACGRAAAVGVALAVVVGVAMTVTDNADPFLGGLRPEAALIPLVEATLTLGLSLWAIDWFRRRWSHAGPLAHTLGRASFAAYLVHAPMTVLLAVALRDVGIPGEVKFIAVFAMSAVAAFGAGRLLTPSKSTPSVS